jgi:hypothetical protein
MAHNPYPSTRDSHPDLTKAILGVVNESHTRKDKELEALSISRLRDLKEKPGAAGDAAHAPLHKTVKGILGTPKTAP